MAGVLLLLLLFCLPLGTAADLVRAAPLASQRAIAQAAALLDLYDRQQSVAPAELEFLDPLSNSPRQYGQGDDTHVGFFVVVRTRWWYPSHPDRTKE